jgi:uncharacterized membrane protein
MDSDVKRPPPIIPTAAKGNIETIMEIEQAHLRQRSTIDRLGESIANFFGSISFVLLQLAVVVGWILVSTLFVPLDPYPFSFLALVVALEALILSTFVLMTQNRQARQAEHWVHLTLQIGLLAEQETTKLLEMLGSISRHLGLEKTGGDNELREMVGKTSIGVLAQELAENLEKTRDTGEASETEALDSNR